MPTDLHIFDADLRPGIEVYVGPTWRPGELRAWLRRGNGWWGYVDYFLPGARPVTTTVPTNRIRSDDPRANPPDTVSSGYAST